MQGLLFVALTWVVTIAIAIGFIFLGKKYVYTKVRINKYIPLAVAVILFLLQFFKLVGNMYIGLLTTVIILFCLVWFVDVQSTGGPKAKEKKIVIKSKAKPNRAKNLKK